MRKEEGEREGGENTNRIEQLRFVGLIVHFFFIVKERMLLQLKVSAPENYFKIKKNPLQVSGLVVL